MVCDHCGSRSFETALVGPWPLNVGIKLGYWMRDEQPVRSSLYASEFIPRPRREKKSQRHFEGKLQSTSSAVNSFRTWFRAKTRAILGLNPLPRERPAMLPLGRIGRALQTA